MSEAVYSKQIGESGARIAFVHGLFGQGKNFTQAAKALLPDAQSLLIDMPNHGKSEWTDRIDYIELADAVADELRAWSNEPVHLVGHSMGGKVAMVLALRHPELIDRLVVVDISPSESAGTDEFEHLLGSLAGLDLSKIERRSQADEQLQDKIPNPTVRGFLLQNLRVASDDTYFWQANLELLLNELLAISGFPEIDAQFDHPVLWMAGEQSDYITEANEAAMRQWFPATRHVTIKGAGHWVHSEQPEAFVSALRVFLSL